MKLVKIDVFYVNPERIDMIGRKADVQRTNIFIGGSEVPLEIKLPIEEVVELLCCNKEGLLTRDDLDDLFGRENKQKSPLLPIADR